MLNTRTCEPALGLVRSTRSSPVPVVDAVVSRRGLPVTKNVPKLMTIPSPSLVSSSSKSANLNASCIKPMTWFALRAMAMFASDGDWLRMPNVKNVILGPLNSSERSFRPGTGSARKSINGRIGPRYCVKESSVGLMIEVRKLPISIFTSRMAMSGTPPPMTPSRVVNPIAQSRVRSAVMLGKLDSPTSAFNRRSANASVAIPALNRVLAGVCLISAKVNRFLVSLSGFKMSTKMLPAIPVPFDNRLFPSRSDSERMSLVSPSRL